MAIHKSFKLDELGGFPINQKQLAFMQEAYSDLHTAISKLVGDNTIITGVEVEGGQVSDGFVVVGGELMPFIGGANNGYFHVVSEQFQLKFKDGTSKVVKFNKYATPTPTGIPLSSLTRLKNYKEISSLFDRQNYQEIDKPTYKLNVWQSFANHARIEGVIYPHNEDLANGTADIIINELPFYFNTAIIYALAYFQTTENETLKTITSVCKVVVHDREKRISLKALTPPAAAEVYNTCFVIISNEFNIL